MRNNTSKIIIRLKDANFLKSKVNDRIYRRHFKLNECQCLLNKVTGSAVDNTGSMIAGKFELEKYFDVIELNDDKNNLNGLISWHESELVRLKLIIDS